MDTQPTMDDYMKKLGQVYESEVMKRIKEGDLSSPCVTLENFLASIKGLSSPVLINIHALGCVSYIAGLIDALHKRDAVKISDFSKILENSVNLYNSERTRLFV